MNTPTTVWINLVIHQAQRCHHLAWFLYGWFEREQVLNLDALVAWCLRGAATAQSRSRSSRRDGLDPAPGASGDRSNCRSRPRKN
jgi:hypothetical protein